MKEDDLAAVLGPLVARWGAFPDVMAARLIGDMAAGGLAIVPLRPTLGMVAASRRALLRHGHCGWLTEDRQHALRLADAVAHGAMEVRMRTRQPDRTEG